MQKEKERNKVDEPTFQDVLEAKKILAKYLARTPLHQYDSLSKMLGVIAFVKHENHLPTGAFKVRGGINLVSRLDEHERMKGVITASTGNHAQSIAYASKIFGVHAKIIMPERANPLKVEATKSYGAEVVFHGKDFDEAREYAEDLASKEDYRYIHSANEPLLIAGVATCALEIVEDLPNVEVIITPVGGGSCVSGACVVAKTINPKIEVIGVQSEKAPAAYKSWKEKKLVSDKMETFAEGLATRVGFELTQRILAKYLDDFLLVSESEIRSAMVTMIETTHNLAEAAGATPLAGVLKFRDRFRGKKVALVLSGGNTSLVHLREALSQNS